MDTDDIKEYLDGIDGYDQIRLVIIPRRNQSKLLNINKKQHEKLKTYLKSNKFKKKKIEFDRYYYRDIIIEENEKYSLRNIKLNTEYLSFMEIRKDIDDFDFPYIVKYDSEENIGITRYELKNILFEMIETNDEKYFRIVLELNDDLSLKSEKSDITKHIEKIFDLKF